MNNTDSFQGMTALVTGASSGIGAAAVHALGTRGADVLVHYHRQENEARGVLERLAQAGGRGDLVQADLSTMDGVRRLVQAVDGR